MEWRGEEKNFANVGVAKVWENSNFNWKKRPRFCPLAVQFLSCPPVRHMYHSTAACFPVAEDYNKENIAPVGYVAPPPSNRGLAAKKGLAPSSKPLAEIQTNTSSVSATTTVVRIQRTILIEKTRFVPTRRATGHKRRPKSTDFLSFAFCRKLRSSRPTKPS